MKVLYPKISAFYNICVLTLIFHILPLSLPIIVAQVPYIDTAWISDSLIEETRSYLTSKSTQEHNKASIYFDSLQKKVSHSLDSIQSEQEIYKARKLLSLIAYYRRVLESKPKIAKELLIKAHTLLPATSLGDKNMRFVEGSLANTADRNYNYERADYFYDRCIRYWTSVQDNSNLLISIKDLANSYTFRGDSINAKKYLARANNLSHHLNTNEDRIKYLEAQIEYNFRFHVEGFERHYSELSRLLNIDETKVNRKPKRRAHNEWIFASILLKNKEYEKAAVHINAALRHQALASNAGIRSRSKAKYLNVKAEILKEQGSLDSAIVILQKGLQELLDKKYDDYTTVPEDSIFHENSFIWLYNTLGDIYLSQYRSPAVNKESYLVKAWNSYKMATYVNTLFESDISSKQSRALRAKDHRAILNKLVYIAFELRSLDKNKLSTSEVKALFRESKNRLWLENTRAIYASKVFDKADINTLAIYRKQILRLLNDPVQQLAWIDSTSAIHSKYGIKLLPQDTLSRYLDYLYTDSALYLLTDLQQPYFFKLSSKSSIDSAYAGFNNLLVSKNDSEIKESLKALTTILLPLTDIPDELCVIPDSYLTQFPFESLIYKNKYLLERSAIHYAYHHWIFSSDIKDQKEPIIYILKPDYEYAGYDVPTTDRAQLGALPQAQKEVNSIIEYYPTYSLPNTSTRDTILKYAKNSILHFTGHAKATDTSSYLALVNPIGTIEKLESKEFYYWPYQYELVVLSACESGLGSFTHGEGIKSLSSNLLQSGTKSIVHTSWLAHDQSTSKLIQLFYHNLTKGMKKNKALQQAKLTYLQTASPELRHPYFWAGIKLTGNTHSISKKTNKTWYLILAGIFFISIIFLILKQNNEKIHTYFASA